MLRKFIEKMYEDFEDYELFVVCDAEQLKKMPKSKRDKILSLGGVKSKI